MSLSVYIALPLLYAATLLQVSLLSRLPTAGFFMQPSVLIVMAWSVHRDWREGVIWAFIAGFYIDLFSVSPLGLSSLALIAGVMLAARLEQILPTESRFATPIIVFLGMLTYGSVNLILASWLTPTQIAHYGGRVLPTALWHTAGTVPLIWLIDGLGRVFTQRRIGPRPT